MPQKYKTVLLRKLLPTSGETPSLVALGSVLDGNGGLLAHGSEDGDHEVLALIEVVLDLLTKLALGETDVILGVTLRSHEREEVIIDVDELVLSTGDVGDIHVVGRGRKILELLASEDVNGDKVDLGVTVLAGLRGRHVDNLAGAALDNNVAVLAEGRALHREGGRGASVGGLEGVLEVSNNEYNTPYDISTS